MRFADLTKEQVVELRKEIVLNSLYISDYRNSFDIPCRIVCDFFDGYMDFLSELESEKYGERDFLPIDKFFDEFDNDDNLIEWYHCHEEFGDEDAWKEWSELDEDDQDFYEDFNEYYDKVFLKKNR